MGVALTAQELGDLGLDGGLQQQAHAEAGDLLQHVAQLTFGSEHSSMSARTRSTGDTRVDTGVGSFLCSEGFERNLRPSSIYTGDRTPPGFHLPFFIRGIIQNLAIALCRIGL